MYSLLFGKTQKKKEEPSETATHLIVQGLCAEAKWRVDAMSIEGRTNFLCDGQAYL